MINRRVSVKHSSRRVDVCKDRRTSSGDDLSRDGDDETDDSEAEGDDDVEGSLLGLVRVSAGDEGADGGEEEGRRTQDEGDGVALEAESLGTVRRREREGGERGKEVGA